MMEHPSRRSLLSLLVAVLVAAGPLAAAAATTIPPTFEGLVKVRSKQLDAVYLLPGADFRGYTKVMIDPVEVSFRKDWAEKMNRTQGAPRRRIDEKDAQEIAGAMRSGFADIFAAAFREKGYDVVTAAAPDVLRLSPAVVDLYINAPAAVSAGVQRTYTVHAGEATLALSVHDSTTGALLGLAIDRRETRDSGQLQYTTSVSNRAAFEDLFRRWANICTKGLQALKSRPGM